MPRSARSPTTSGSSTRNPSVNSLRQRPTSHPWSSGNRLIDQLPPARFFLHRMFRAPGPAPVIRVVTNIALTVHRGARFPGHRHQVLTASERHEISRATLFLPNLCKERHRVNESGGTHIGQCRIYQCFSKKQLPTVA